MRFRLIFWFSVLLHSLCWADSAAVTGEKSIRSIDASPWLAFLPDPDQQIDYDTARSPTLHEQYQPWQNAPTQLPQRFWLRFDPSEIKAHENRYVIYIPHRPLDTISLYLTDDKVERIHGRHWLVEQQAQRKRFVSEYNLTWWENAPGNITTELHDGLTETARFRNGHHIHYRFWIDSKYFENKHPLYLYIDASAQPLRGPFPVHLYSASAYLQDNLLLYLTATAYYSMMASILLFTLVLWLRVRDSSLLLYCGCLFLWIFNSTYYDGIWFSIIDPGAGKSTLQSFRSSAILGGLCFLWFCHQLLSPKKSTHLFSPHLALTALTGFICFIGFFLDWNWHINTFFLSISYLFPCITLGLSVRGLIAKSPYSRSVLLMSLIQITSIIIYASLFTQYGDHTFWSPWIIHIGNLSCALLLSMILASQFVQIRTEVSTAHSNELAANREAEKQRKENLEKSRFLAQASHDLRQPLHSVSLLIATLKLKSNNNDQIGIIESIQKSIRSMNAMFADILDISRIDSGIMTPSKQWVSISDLFVELDNEWKSTAIEKNLELRFASHTRWHVFSDPILLKRILRNLLINSLRYTRTGSILVGCRVSQRGIRIDVMDSGVGIDSSHLKQIFDEFYRIQTAAYENPLSTEGLGLGLSIVKRLSESLSHPISVRSQTGCGSRFSITIHDAVRYDHQQKSDKKSPSSSDDHDLTDRVIAVIDDNEDILNSVQKLLTSTGCIVLTATDAENLIREIKNRDELQKYYWWIIVWRKKNEDLKRQTLSEIILEIRHSPLSLSRVIHHQKPS